MRNTSSPFFRVIVPKLYALGAAVVIFGAMFKILHLPGAGLMLGVGLTTEALIFFINAFEPPVRELDWTRVYPELGEAYAGSKRRPHSGSVTQQLDKVLEKSRVGPELIDSLGKGMRHLAESTSRLGAVSNAMTATNEYAQNLKKSSHALSQMNASYGTAISALSEVSSSSELTKNYTKELQGVTKNLSALNAVYEMELKDSNTHLKALNKFYENVSATMQNVAEAGKSSTQFRNELVKLTGNLTNLNKVYGDILAVMRG